MVTIARIYLRRKEEHKWFINIANKIHKFGSIWEASDKGYVWTHKRHGGKVRFLLKTVRGAGELKIWHPSAKDRFKQAQAVGDFSQWIYEHGRDYVRRIQVFVPQ